MLSEHKAVIDAYTRNYLTPLLGKEGHAIAARNTIEAVFEHAGHTGIPERCARVATLLKAQGFGGMELEDLVDGLNDYFNGARRPPRRGKRGDMEYDTIGYRIGDVFGSVHSMQGAIFRYLIANGEASLTELERTSGVDREKISAAISFAIKRVNRNSTTHKLVVHRARENPIYRFVER